MLKMLPIDRSRSHPTRCRPPMAPATTPRSRPALVVGACLVMSAGVGTMSGLAHAQNARIASLEDRVDALERGVIVLTGLTPEALGSELLAIAENCDDRSVLVLGRPSEEIELPRPAELGDDCNLEIRAGPIRASDDYGYNYLIDTGNNNDLRGARIHWAADSGMPALRVYHKQKVIVGNISFEGGGPYFELQASRDITMDSYKAKECDHEFCGTVDNSQRVRLNQPEAPDARVQTGYP